jgi:hypothetical protein
VGRDAVEEPEVTADDHGGSRGSRARVHRRSNGNSDLAFVDLRTHSFDRTQEIELRIDDLSHR